MRWSSHRLASSSTSLATRYLLMQRTCTPLPGFLISLWNREVNHASMRPRPARFGLGRSREPAAGNFWKLEHTGRNPKQHIVSRTEDGWISEQIRDMLRKQHIALYMTSLLHASQLILFPSLPSLSVAPLAVGLPVPLKAHTYCSDWYLRCGLAPSLRSLSSPLRFHLTYI